MNDAELNVNLKLNAEQAKQDAQKAGEQIANSAGGIFKKTVDPAQLEAQRKLISQLGEASVRAANREAKIKMDSHVGLYRYMEREDNKRTQKNLRYMRLTESMAKNYSMLSGVVLNPGGGLTTMFAARQIFQARRDQAARDRLTGQKGEGITRSILSTVGIVSGATAAGYAFVGLTKAIQESQKALKLWGQSAASGLSVGFNIRRSATSAVMGVSESDAVRFMGALKNMGPELNTALKIIEQTNPVTARVGSEFEALKLKMQALVAAFAQQIGPGLIDAFNQIGKGLIWLINQLQKGGGAVAFAAAYWGSKSTGASTDEALKVAESQTKQRFEEYKMPAASQFMKQMPASTWERMGLVVGGGGGTNYGKQTVDELKKLNRQIATKLGVGDRQHAATYALA